MVDDVLIKHLPKRAHVAAGEGVRASADELFVWMGHGLLPHSGSHQTIVKLSLAG